MKKLIVTLCSLALSLAGTFGINQLASNDEAIIDRNTQQVNIEQDAEAVKNTEVADKVKIETKDEVEVAAPKAEDTEIKDTNNTKEEREVKEDKKEQKDEQATVKSDMQSTVKNNDKKDKQKSSNKKVVNTNVNKEVTKQVTTNKTSEKPVTNYNENNSAANNSNNKASDYINDFKSNGNNVFVYKNVDLSDCNSTQDVVKELAPTTTPTKPAPTTPPTNNSGSNQGFAEEVLRLVNIERSKAGLSSLTTNATLKAAADKRAQETKTSFSHTRPNGSKFSTVLQEYGISYRTAGENIAYGQRSPQEVVNGWMNSPGHRANILNGSFGKIGIGVYQSGGVIYWSQLFTN